MKKTIVLLPGDGIGPEVMAEAQKVLELMNTKFDHNIECVSGLIGGAAWDQYAEHFPQQTIDLCEGADAILFGSVGGPVDAQHLPKWQGCETQSILAIRKHFGFTINLRPTKVYETLKNLCVLRSDIVEQGIDILCVRELSSGIYFGEHRTEGDRAFDVMTYDRATIETVARAAFEAAFKRRKKLHSVDKANVLDCSKLWRKVVTEVAADYPAVQLEHILVDNCTMQLLKNPGQFDVLLTPNMFGDILSDEMSVFAGSLGMLPSASLNAEGFGLYEPSGGSAPDIAGQGKANPIAQILSAAMMLKYSFGLHEEHDAIVTAVEKALASGARTGDIAGKEDKILSTSQMGDIICKHLESYE